MNVDYIGLPIECAIQGRALLDLIESSRKDLYAGVNELLRKGAARPIAEIRRFDAETAITESEISRDSLQAARTKIRSDCKNAHCRHCVPAPLVIVLAGRNGIYASTHGKCVCNQASSRGTRRIPGNSIVRYVIKDTTIKMG